MRYFDGTTVTLGDLVTVPVPSGTAKGRVVMLGESDTHLDIDAKFLAWVTRDKLLDSSSIVFEWVEKNPLAHDNPRYAPVGPYMFSPLDEWVKRVV